MQNDRQLSCNTNKSSLLAKCRSTLGKRKAQRLRSLSVPKGPKI
jgi:hypothetical protein